MGIFWAILGLGIMIFAHELGHFILAKLSGVGVEKFSLGFGKKLIGKKIGETEYLISALPLGGYVKMVGENEDGEELSEADKARSFNHQPVYKRLAIVVAGPLFNILLAVLFCYIVLVTGDPTPVARVSEVEAGSAASVAGFQPGDIIAEVDGQPVAFWIEVTTYLGSHKGKDVRFTVSRNDIKSDITASVPEVGDWKALGLYGKAVVASVKEGSPADVAGMKVDDRITSVDGEKVGVWEDMASIVRVNPGKALHFTVERKDGTAAEMDVVPDSEENPDKPGENIGRVGILRGYDQEYVKYGAGEAVGLSFQKTYLMTNRIVGFLGSLVSGNEKASNIGGPIAIVQLSERQAKRGFADFVIFMALLSVNLGVINLMPIPVLDGGVILFLIVESIMGEPLSMRKREMIQQIGLFLIISLMVFVIGMDIARTFGFLEVWK